MIIGIIGKARAGKDTFGLMLAEELFNISRQRYVLMSYAHELKLRIQKDFDLSYEQLWGEEKEICDNRYKKPYSHPDWHPRCTDWTPREIMQSYGDFYRTINNNFWADHLFEIIDDKEYKRVIITDVRHINEADPIIDRKGFLIKVVRDIDNDIHGQGHISEVALDNYDIGLVIENNGTLKDLKSAAKEVAKKLIEEKTNGKSKE